VFRVLLLAGFAAAPLTLTGCAGFLDTIQSRKFRKEPFGTMQRAISPEDPMVVLRADPPRDGDDRAKAMRRLKEPLKNSGTQMDQDEVIDILARAATADPSPVLRLAAVDALGRFEDARAVQILMVAYQKASGQKDGGTPGNAADAAIQQVSGGRRPTRNSDLDRLLAAPTGYPPETVTVIRSRTLESLGRTNTPEAAKFLASVAGGPSGGAVIDGSDDRDVRLAAVRGLTKCRQPESVVALAQVLGKEKDKDTAIVGRAHDGLVRLTGKNLPPDPQKWNEVVQAGVVIAPEPTWVENAAHTVTEWVK
jgi:HEAT repeat protein